MTTADMDKASMMLAGAVNRIMQETGLTSSAMFYVAKSVVGQLAELRTEELILSMQPQTETEGQTEAEPPPEERAGRTSVTMSDIRETLKAKREQGLLDADGKAHATLGEAAAFAQRKAEQENDNTGV